MKLALSLTMVAVLLATASAYADTVYLLRGQTIVVQRADVNAAYTTDDDVAGVSVQNGRVTVSGRHAGKTLLVLVVGDEVETFELTVTAPQPLTSELLREAAAQKSTRWEGLYNSETDRFTSGLDVSSRVGARTATFHLSDVTSTRQRLGTDARTSIPSLSLRIKDDKMEFTAFDATVNDSPLSVDGTSLRGVHYRGDRLEVHGGYTSPLLFQNVFLPSASEAAVGASYRLPGPGRSSWLPHLYYFSGDRRYGGVSGLMGSLVHQIGSRLDRLRTRVEVGYGRRAAAAAELTYLGTANQASLEARYQPDGFASIGFGRRSGTYVDGNWTGLVKSALTLNASGRLDSQVLPFFRQRTTTSSAGVRYRLGSGWAVDTGETYAQFDSGGRTPNVRSLTLPIGVSFDSRRAGIAALYRYQENSATNNGGSGGRLNARAKFSDLSLSGSVDYQKDAATVDLVFRNLPELERAFLELGVAARTPEDIADLLRNNAALVALGYLDAPSVTLQPYRLQSSVDVTWAPPGPARQQLKLRVIQDQTQGLQWNQRTTLANASYSRHITRGLEAVGNVGYWKRNSGSGTITDSWSIGFGARIRFSGLPSIPGTSRHVRIKGLIYRDADAAGRYATSLPGIAGVHVVLDGIKEAITDTHGRFEIEAASGTHRLDVRPPTGTAAYFTTPSSTTFSSDTTFTVGIAYSPARIQGSVLDDVGTPVGGVSVRLTGGDREQVITTDSSGAYSFTVPPGDYTAKIQPDSLPAGYVAAAKVHQFRLARGIPAQADYAVVANRSISGTVKAAKRGRAIVSIVELNRAAETDEEGHYVFRNMKPGNYTLVTEMDGLSLTRHVEVPSGPAMVHGVDFEPNIRASR